MTALWLNLNHIRPRISFFYESSLFVYRAIQYWFERWACLTFEEVFVRNHPPFPWWTERARHRCAVHYRPKVLESRFSSVVKCIEKVFFWNYSLVYTTNFLLIFIIIGSKLILEIIFKNFSQPEASYPTFFLSNFSTSWKNMSAISKFMTDTV